ncbi:MAG: glycosyltransferase family 4 protein [Pyrinomonadaceae bacterium]|nr:glycosyltransferase family 4 protein [Pyrinomonadaceae bacterium]
MRILIATTQVPFIRGGAEAHAEGLREALRLEGHEAEIIAVPFKWYPAEKILDHMLACRLLDVTEYAGTPIDLLIGLKFPAYLIPHPNKVVWILHQHRTAYELWDHPLGDLIYEPDGALVRDAIHAADKKILAEAKSLYANSGNVARRLKQYCGLDSQPLYHPPPHAEEFYTAETVGDYLFFPSRLCRPKRQSLVLEALARTREHVRVSFAGTPDLPSYINELQSLARKLKVQQRVEWLGQVSEDEKRRLYAESIGVLYPPIDEDYGYVTLEAMLAAKPVITCTDSGGPLEFVRDNETGLVAEPTIEGLAARMDQLWKHKEQSREWGRRGRALYDEMGISWANVVRTLLVQKS